MARAESFTIRDDFPAADYDQWRKLVEVDLKGAPFEKKLVTHTYEGIDLQPLYTRKDFPSDGDPYGFPGQPPFVRGSEILGALHAGLDLRQEFAHPDLRATNQAILEDLAGGVTSVLLRLDASARSGLDADQAIADRSERPDGILACSVDDLDALLAGVQLELIGVALDSGAAFLPAAGLLAALWQRRGTSPDKAHGAFNADPLAVLASAGELPHPVEVAFSQLANLARWTSQTCAKFTSVGVDTSPYHHAGATAAQDLAFAMATGVQYLRTMTGAGMEINAAARQILFRISLGTHHFLAIGKLRAARRLWWQVVEACGGSPSAGKMRIHARTSNRVLTRRDPYVNMLRNTASVFAACIGGAEAITSVPFDHLVGPPNELSRRVARNTLLILQEEGHLNRVIDPAGGSWFLDRIAEDLACEAWPIFQEIERQGGMLAALSSGWIAEQIDASFGQRAQDIARRKEPITGVSEFPNVGEEQVAHTPLDVAVVRAAAAERVQSVRSRSGNVGKLISVSEVVDAAKTGATIGQLADALGLHQSPTRIGALEARGFAEPFEELRDAADAWQAEHGSRPRVFLANMGPIAHHSARAAYSKNFFEAGGFEVITNDGFKDDSAAAAAAFTESGASIAVICSSDKLYPELVPNVAQRLKAAGARSVVLAGNPGENEATWRAAGVDRFIFIKCDVLATLREILQEEGVLRA